MSNSTQTQLAPGVGDAPSAAGREPNPAAPGLRERKKEQTRERLKQAAFHLFTERGFDEVTVDEIADRAEVSKSTLFRYFETKEDLLLVDARMHRDALLHAMADRPRDEPVLASLRAALQSMAADYQADRVRAVQRNRIIAECPSLAARSLERQVAWEDGLAAVILPRLDGEADAATRAAVLAAAAMAVVRVATRRWIASDDDTEMIDHVLAALDLLIDELEPSRPTVRSRTHRGDR
ncbi:MAG: TetR family transcriptional regulator [Actinobacteria bacterium]|nr:TetR family transcriptional regulator [Actinomycetota bacterium]